MIQDSGSTSIPPDLATQLGKLPSEESHEAKEETDTGTGTGSLSHIHVAACKRLVKLQANAELLYQSRSNWEKARVLETKTFHGGPGGNEESSVTPGPALLALWEELSPVVEGSKLTTLLEFGRELVDYVQQQSGESRVS